MDKIFLSSLYKYNGKSLNNLSNAQKYSINEMKNDFNNDILKLETNKCICLSDNDITISTKDRLVLYLKIVFCNRYGILRANPRISDDTINIFYEKYYRNLTISENEIKSGRDPFSNAFNRKLRNGKIILFDFIKEYPSLNNSLVFEF